MRNLIYSVALFVSILVSAPFAQAASPNLAGSWNITFFLEPARTTGATQCIVFRLVPGTVSGVLTSGTWFSPTFPGWSGQWIQLGDHVRFFGVTPGLATSASGNLQSNLQFGGVSFNHFLKANALTSTAGSWRGVRVAACPRVNQMPSFDSDPSNKAG